MFISLVIIFVAEARSSSLIYIAYLLTPLTPIVMLIWARVKDNLGRTSVFYDIGKSQTIIKISSILALIGFLIATSVVWEIASRWAIEQ